eukprot:3173776-Rhodomonas_salina.2
MSRTVGSWRNVAVASAAVMVLAVGVVSSWSSGRVAPTVLLTAKEMNRDLRAEEVAFHLRLADGVANCVVFWLLHHLIRDAARCTRDTSPCAGHEEFLEEP